MRTGAFKVIWFEFEVPVDMAVELEVPVDIVVDSSTYWPRANTVNPANIVLLLPKTYIK